MKLQSIQKFCGGRNIPGLVLIEYAPLSWVNVNSFERILSDNYNFQKDISFNTGGWLAAPSIPFKEIWQERQRKKSQGPYHVQTIRAVVPELRAEVSGEFEKMKHHTYIMRLTDTNGRKWLVGSPDSPFIFSQGSATGAKSGDLASYELVWNCETKNAATGFVPVF